VVVFETNVLVLSRKILILRLKLERTMKWKNLFKMVVMSFIT